MLKDLQHSIRIESPVSNVGLGIRAKLQLSCLLRGTAIDTGRSQTLEVFTTLIRVDYVDCLVSAFETILYERQQEPYSSSSLLNKAQT